MFRPQLTQLRQIRLRALQMTLLECGVDPLGQVLDDLFLLSERRAVGGIQDKNAVITGHRCRVLRTLRELLQRKAGRAVL